MAVQSLCSEIQIPLPLTDVEMMDFYPSLEIGGRDIRSINAPMLDAEERNALAGDSGMVFKEPIHPFVKLDFVVKERNSILGGYPSQKVFCHATPYINPSNGLNSLVALLKNKWIDEVLCTTGNHVLVDTNPDERVYAKEYELMYIADDPLPAKGASWKDKLLISDSGREFSMGDPKILVYPAYIEYSDGSFPNDLTL